MLITFPDGAQREFADGMTGVEIAAAVSPRLAKATLSCAIDGVHSDAFRPITGDHALRFYTFADENGRWAYRHTGSHVLAQAVKRLHPEIKLAIGPAIENGFYYDFDAPAPFTPDDLAAIEKEMEKITQENLPLERFELPREEAIAYMEKLGEPYKVELIRDLPEDAVISFYRQGEFVDLCAGPHIASTGRFKNAKLMSVAGAYWRGSEKNKMLQRIYGTAFEKKADLDAYLTMLEEAKKRDHRKLGKELGLFTILDEGPGFPFFLPKGMALKNELISYWREVHKRYGYVEIATPMILNRRLWETSGHWFHYKDNMYTTVIDDEDYAIKPMNCPGGMLAYKTEMHSYRDLPLRVAELGLVHRHELSGALHGLFRVRCFTQDDAHIFMTWEQMKDEIKGVIRLFDEIYSTFGLPYKIELSTMPEDHMGEEAVWDFATQTLRDAIVETGKPYTVNEGDGAFYGPKLDVNVKPAVGAEYTLSTCQLDFCLPAKFHLTYVDKDGTEKTPVVLHRAILGSLDRFMAYLIEETKGKFPTWLAPVQVKVLPVSEKTLEYAEAITEKLVEAGVRVALDDDNQKIGYKIRAAQQVDRVPYMLVLGAKEAEAGNVSVRDRKGETTTMEVDEFIAKVTAEIKNRSL